MEWVLISWPILILLGLALRMALHLHYGARGPDAGDPIYVFLNTNSWVLIVLGLAPIIIGGAVTGVGLIILILAAVTLVEFVVERRGALRRSFCRLLALVLERGEQIEPAVLFAGQATGGAVGRAARKLFAALGAGTPLVPAIRKFPSALPRQAAAYAAAGRTSKSEAAALRELSRSEQNELAGVWRAVIDRISYLAAVLLVMASVMTFLMIKIVPAFRDIYEDFDMQLPAMTELAIAVSEFVVLYLWIPLMGVGLMLVIATAVVGFCYLIDVPVLQSWGDRFFRGRRNADVLRILAVATEERQSLSTVFDRLAVVYPVNIMRRRLAPVAASINAGGDWRDALREARIVSPAEQSLLKTAEQVGNLPWALRSIARRNEQRAVYRLAAAAQVIYPAVILMLGAFIGFYVVALFIPLVRMIQSLAV